MLTSQIKSNEIVFGSCNKDLLEEIIFYGIGLGADFIEIFVENNEVLSDIASSDGNKVSKTFKKLPKYLSNGYQLLRLYLLKPLNSKDFQPSIR